MSEIPIEKRLFVEIFDEPNPGQVGPLECGVEYDDLAVSYYEIENAKFPRLKNWTGQANLIAGIVYQRIFYETIEDIADDLDIRIDPSIRRNYDISGCAPEQT